MSHRESFFSFDLASSQLKSVLRTFSDNIAKNVSLLRMLMLYSKSYEGHFFEACRDRAMLPGAYTLRFLINFQKLTAKTLVNSEIASRKF